MVLSGGSARRLTPIVPKHKVISDEDCPIGKVEYPIAEGNLRDPRRAVGVWYCLPLGGSGAGGTGRIRFPPDGKLPLLRLSTIMRETQKGGRFPVFPIHDPARSRAANRPNSFSRLWFSPFLNAIYEVDFQGFSYGFRPGRSPHQALAFFSSFPSLPVAHRLNHGTLVPR